MITMEDKNIPQQVAFMVEKYMLHSNFSSTHSTFKDEASSLIPQVFLCTFTDNLSTPLLC